MRSIGSLEGCGPAFAINRDMKHRILIVDDEEPILFAMSDYFASFGYHVDCAQARDEAEALLASTRYSAAIADLRLTGSQGAEGLDIIGSIRERSPSTRIILMTAYGAPEVEMEARRRGVDVVLHKPKPLPEVAHIMFGLLGKEL